MPQPVSLTMTGKPSSTGHPHGRLQRAAEVAVTPRLGHLLRRVQMDSQGVRRDRFTSSRTGDVPAGQLDPAQVREQVHAGRGAPHLVRPVVSGRSTMARWLPRPKGMPAASAATASARLISPAASSVPAGHPGDHEGGPERTSKQRGGPAPLRRPRARARRCESGGRHQATSGDESRPLAGRGDGQVIRLTLTDSALGHCLTCV